MVCKARLSQPSTIAAGALHRPAATSRNLRHPEVQQPPITSNICTNRRLGKHPADRVDCCGGKGVAVGIHPMTPSIVPASLVIKAVSLPRHHGHAGLEDTARHICDESQPAEGWTGCSSGQQAADQVDAGTRDRQLVTKATWTGA
jgi:hypothetical protein